MNPGGMFKVALWLAPVVAFLFFYISQKQEAQVDDMKAEFSKFDEDFARMSAGISTGNEKIEWQEVKEKAALEHKQAKEKASASQKKVDDSFAAMEKEMMEADADSIIKSNQ